LETGFLKPSSWARPPAEHPAEDQTAQKKQGDDEELPETTPVDAVQRIKTGDR